MERNRNEYTVTGKRVEQVKERIGVKKQKNEEKQKIERKIEMRKGNERKLDDK